MGKTDPQLVVYGNEAVFKHGISNEFDNDDRIKWIELGRTECIKNQLNPVFQKTVRIEYNYNRSFYFN
jgi:hypothetical protein